MPAWHALPLTTTKKTDLRKAVEDAVLAQYGVAVGADQHSGLGIPKDVVLL